MLTDREKIACLQGIRMFAGHLVIAYGEEFDMIGRAFMGAVARKLGVLDSPVDLLTADAHGDGPSFELRELVFGEVGLREDPDAD